MTLLTIYLIGFILHFGILSLNIYKHQRHLSSYHWYAYVGVAFTGLVWLPFWVYITVLRFQQPK
jgi:hypothetical protein